MLKIDTLASARVMIYCFGAPDLELITAIMRMRIIHGLNEADEISRYDTASLQQYDIP